MKIYRRAQNCGPVPYPDGSGKFLTNDRVTGDDWEPLVALGFVVFDEVELPPVEPVADIKPETEYNIPEVVKDNVHTSLRKNDGKRSKTVHTPKTGTPNDQS
jgi:hypothetical protein